jgi:hypothetical protein
LFYNKEIYFILKKDRFDFFVCVCLCDENYENVDRTISLNYDLFLGKSEFIRRTSKKQMKYCFILILHCVCVRETNIQTSHCSIVFVARLYRIVGCTNWS